jgi:hypothetical protein
LAIDSLPLADDIYGTFDYSGYQLHGLPHLPLHRAAQTVKMSEDKRSCSLTLSERTWNDGKTIVVEEYLEGLNRLLTAQPRLAQYLRSKLRAAKYSGSTLTLDFSSPLPATAALFALPNWVPFRAGFFSGEFHVARAAHGWNLTGRSGERGYLRLVNSPEENSLLFDNGLLDFSADTAIRLGSVDSHVLRRDTGMLAALVYSRQLSDAAAANVERALAGLRFAPAVENIFPSLRPAAVPVAEAQPGEISLAYDAFYPNLEICQQVARHLQARGWKVRLVEDSYYRPQSRADLKFMILRPSANLPLFHALLMRSMPRAALQRVSIQNHIEQVERGGEHNMDELARLRLAYPLFSMPSLYRARKPVPNPLLEIFA